MKIEDIIKQIGDATALGDWRQVQSLAGTLKTRARDNGHGISGQAAMALVDALAQGVTLGAGALGGADSSGVFDKLETLLKAEPLDRTALKTNWDSMYGVLADSTVAVSETRLLGLMDVMRSKRMFESLAKTGDRAITRFPDNLKMKRLYAQALIDQGQVHAAIMLLEGQTAALEQKIKDGKAEPADRAEYKEMCGLLGRSNKQIYIDNVRSISAPTSVRESFKPYLRKAVENYKKIYELGDPGVEHWHGVNLAALLRVAGQDKHHDIVALFPKSAGQVATDIINKQKATADAGDDVWTIASVAEAYLIAGDQKSAAEYIRRYVEKPIDNFAIMATSRQFEEVLRISEGDHGTAEILAILKAKQVSSPEARFILNGDTLHKQAAVANSPEYKQLHEDITKNLTGAHLETMTAGGSFLTLELLSNVVQCAQAIAAMNDPQGKTWGTGFLVRGESIKAGWGNDIYLVTNAHVLSCPTWKGEHTPNSPLRPEIARLVLQATSGRAPLTLEKTASFQSRPGVFDATIIKVVGDTTNLKTLEFFPPNEKVVAEDPDNPRMSSPNTVSVIGCPLGGPLSLSIVGTLEGANGILIDIGPRGDKWEDPIYLHYRAPTQPGNSGSPVFCTKTWKVVGLHHEGFDEFHGRPRLAGRTGKNFGNEGISIQSIRRAVERDGRNV